MTLEELKVLLIQKGYTFRYEDKEFTIPWGVVIGAGLLLLKKTTWLIAGAGIYWLLTHKAIAEEVTPGV